MKKLLKIGLLVGLMIAVTSLLSIAQDKEQAKRGVGVTNFYLSIKDKIGISKEQEDKLMNIEKDAAKKLEGMAPTLGKAQQSLNAITREDEIDLTKTRELLNSIASLEAEVRFTIIEAVTLEKRVLTKEQREKADAIAREMSKGPQK